MPEWIGKTIGKVRIDKLLAQGGMAEVYLGTHLTLDRPVAIKVLHSYVADDEELRERLEREAKVVAGFRHPNIVQVYDFDTIDGHPYIVMEYLRGPTLAVFLADLHKQNKRLPTDHVVRLLKGPAAALDYAHGLGVIHRDVKPGNIMLHGLADDAPPGPGRVSDLNAVMTDFGLLHVTGATHQTSIGTIAGTPNYMSPEQAGGDTVDFRSDIYSFGVVLYEMLAGRAPFDGDSTLTVMYKQIHVDPPPIPHLAEPEQAVISRALAKNPADRYQSCNELEEAFQAAVTESKAQAVANAAVATLIPAAVGGEGAEIASTGVANAAGAKEKNREQQPPRARPAFLVPAVIAGMAVLVLAVGAFLIVPRLGPSPTQDPGQETPSATANVVAPPAIPNPEGMAKIPAGDYEVGFSEADDFHSARQTVSLNEFWIDKLLVTNEQYQAYLDQTGAPTPQVWPGDAKHPVRGVTWGDANAYCAAMNKRLPVEAEWEVAGRGRAENAPLFPWGDDPTDNGKVLQMPDQDTYDVGSLPFNVSPFGVYDLVGDVWQWVDRAYDTAGAGQKILRGGRFGLPQDLAYRIAVAPDDKRYVKFAGFRCAADKTK